jgi:DNA-binding beta-propeller fold protein YncE
MIRWLASLLLIPLVCLPAAIISPRPALADDANHEVWIIDQSDTTADGGGALYVYDGAVVAGGDAATAVPEVIDLGVDARSFCVAATGTAPRRPHMLFFSPAHTHAVIAFVTTGHVLFMDAATRTPVGCVDVGLQAHAAVPSPDGTFVAVSNQNGKLAQRILTDYATNSFTLDAAATLDLATCTTPNGLPCQDPVLRPDNAPICPAALTEDGLLFQTLRGGGLFVIDAAATPMAIVGEYDSATVHPNGCGGAELGSKIYVNSGGGTVSNPLESDVYRFPAAGYSAANPPNTPAPTLVFSQDGLGFVDSHGVALTKHGRFLWVADRAANKVVVVDTATDTVVNEFTLVGSASGDPAPDLVDISPSGTRVYFALRGPNPLTGNAPAVNNAVGSTPGLGVVRVQQGGRTGVLHSVAPISHVVGGIERADPHAVRVRHK